MKRILILNLLISLVYVVNAQIITLASPDRNLIIQISNGQKLEYSVMFKDKAVVNPSLLGFEFRDEPPLTGNFALADSKTSTYDETWIPVVKSKHPEAKRSGDKWFMGL